MEPAQTPTPVPWRSGHGCLPAPPLRGRAGPWGCGSPHLTYTLAPCNSYPGSRAPRAPTEQGHAQSCCLARRCLGLGSGS